MQPWLDNFETIISWIPEPRNIMELSARQVSLHIKVLRRFLELDVEYLGQHIGSHAKELYLQKRPQLKRNILFFLNHINQLSVYIQKILAEARDGATRDVLEGAKANVNRWVQSEKQKLEGQFRSIWDDKLRQIINETYIDFLGRLNNILPQTQAGGRISIKELMKHRTNVIPGKFSLKI